MIVQSPSLTVLGVHSAPSVSKVLRWATLLQEEMTLTMLALHLRAAVPVLLSQMGAMLMLMSLMVWTF